MILLGISGKARTGKGEFAKVACEEYGFQKLSFAGSLKKEVEDFLNKWNVEWRYDNLYGDNSAREEILTIPIECKQDAFIEDFFKFFGITRGLGKDGLLYFTSRSLMQWWGTEYRRAQDPNYWVKRTIEQMTDQDGKYIIDDVRFENEAISLLDHGAYLIRIERENNPYQVSNPNHESEIGLDEWIEWHYIIENNASIESYHESIHFVINEIMGSKEEEFYAV